MLTKIACRSALILILIIPFLLRERADYLEPYPAILLPDGASLLDVSGGVIIRPETILIAVDGQGAEHELDPVKFFDPIQPAYWPRIVRDNFGLEPRPHPPITKQLSIGLWTFSITHHRTPTDAQRKETTAWLREKAAEQGVANAALIRVRFARTTMRVADQVDVSSELYREVELPLNEQ